MMDVQLQVSADDTVDAYLYNPETGALSAVPPIRISAAERAMYVEMARREQHNTMQNPQDARNQRVELLHRVINDFTYKSEFSDPQNAQWKMVKKHFEGFRTDIGEKVFGAIKDTLGIFNRDTNNIYMMGYQITVRETERWCNTAIANDFNTGYPVDISKYGVESPFYEGPSGGDTPRHQICDYVSQRCFDSIVWLVSVLPVGRALSVAVTRMQDVRGWLLDMVNWYFDHYNNAGNAAE